MVLCLLLTLSAGAQVITTNISSLPYTLVVTNQDEVILQFKDLSATTGYRTRRLSASNLLAYVNANLRGDGGNLTNLLPSITIAGTNVTVVTNTVAGTGQKTYTVGTDTNVVQYAWITNFSVVAIGTTTADQPITGGVTTLQNITELSVNVNANSVYVLHCVIGRANTAVAPSEGFAFDFGGGTATVSYMRVAGCTYAGDNGGNIFAMYIAHAKTDLLPPNPNVDNNGGGTNTVTFEGVVKINAGGTFMPRIKRVSGNSEASHVEQGSVLTMSLKL